ncbi:hypothetical protein [Rhizobium sp. SSA_523]|uniref:hypothetical protein n=1 Tax=Rhizobium sp. SSA_523 TaxID=2952477 RepID=UPI0020908084|nr:hypothetical protein [Rhizobium sp. SSA_523]MCO5734022.1 hypothetical protein [Rhizobium sp. SSA_523]WKC24664.1 hypothetical protein QTJ18_11540 [Rhizobium sp. SSA_523]
MQRSGAAADSVASRAVWFGVALLQSPLMVLDVPEDVPDELVVVEDELEPDVAEPPSWLPPVEV